MFAYNNFLHNRNNNENNDEYNEYVDVLLMLTATTSRRVES